MDNKAELTLNSMNSISGGTLLYEKGDSVDSISLLVKGRVEVAAGGVCTVLASLAYAMWNGGCTSLHIRRRMMPLFLYCQ